MPSPTDAWSGDMLRVVRRRKWWLLLSCAVGIVAGPPVLGAFGALLAAGLAVVLLDHRRGRFSRETDIVSGLSLPVLGTIPVIETYRERQMRIWRRRTLLAVILVSAAIIAFIRFWT